MLLFQPKTRRKRARTLVSQRCNPHIGAEITEHANAFFIDPAAYPQNHRHKKRREDIPSLRIVAVARTRTFSRITMKRASQIEQANFLQLTWPERFMSSPLRLLMAASTLSTSVTTLGTETITSTMLFSRPALMLAETACSLLATVDKWVSRPLLLLLLSLW